MLVFAQFLHTLNPIVRGPEDDRSSVPPAESAANSEGPDSSDDSDSDSDSAEDFEGDGNDNGTGCKYVYTNSSYCEYVYTSSGQKCSILDSARTTINVKEINEFDEEENSNWLGAYPVLENVGNKTRSITKAAGIIWHESGK